MMCDWNRGEARQCRGSSVALFHRERVLRKHALSPVGVFSKHALSPVVFLTGVFSYGGLFYGGLFSRDLGRTLNVPRGLLWKNLLTIRPSPFRTISVICYSHPIHIVTVIYCAKLPLGHCMSGNSIFSTRGSFSPPLTPPRRI